MTIQFRTASGALYTMDRERMTWERYHQNLEVHGLPNDNSYSRNVSNRGTLVEWPVVAVGYRVMFDDVKIGAVYTTQVLESKVL
jgi:hypothetical protein